MKIFSIFVFPSLISLGDALKRLKVKGLKVEKSIKSEIVRKAAKAIKIAFRSTVTLSFIFNSFESTMNLQLAPMQELRP